MAEVTYLEHKTDGVNIHNIAKPYSSSRTNPWEPTFN